MNLRKLSKRASEAIREAGQSGGLDVSAITVWELAWLATHNRPDITGAADAFSEEITSRTAIRPITA